MPASHIITIDGPAASGKSSVARLVARQLEWAYINTGNMYRAVTLAFVEAGVDVKDEQAILAALPDMKLESSVEDGRSIILLNGRDVEPLLNSEAINNAVSHVAKVPQVRERLVEMQRTMGLAQPSVMEGRDIGTVVFPDAPYKFYVDASEEVRASRRGLQGHQDAVRERDRIDSTRKIAPLIAADDAVVIDSSEMTLEQVVAKVLQILMEKGLPVAG